MTVALRLLRDRARGLLWWSMGLTGLVFLAVVVYPSIKERGQVLNDLLNSMPPALKAAFGLDDQIPLTSPAGFLNARLFALLGPVLLLVYAIGIGASLIGGLEESGQLEPLLANPVTRTRVALERLGAAVLLLSGLVAVLAVATLALAPPFGALAGVNAWRLIGAAVAAGCLALLHGCLAFAVGAATGRRTPAVAAATALAVTGYLLQSLSPLTDLLDAFRFVNPWHWYLAQNMLVKGVPAQAVLAPVGVAVALVGLGVVLFGRRDLR